MDISTLIQSLSGAAEVFTVQDILLTTVLSFVLALVIGYVYMITYRGASYTQSYVHTLALMSMVVAVIMLVIGSNIARAFTLVGALSIIRFRNAVKDTRDVGYIFFAMAIGMACGTRFYLVAIVSTAVISALLWSMFYFDMFAKEVREQLLKVRLPVDQSYETLFGELFERHMKRHDLIAVETVQAGSLTELIYSVELKKRTDIQQLLGDIRALNGGNKVSLITGLPEVDI